MIRELSRRHCAYKRVDYGGTLHATGLASPFPQFIEPTNKAGSQVLNMILSWAVLGLAGLALASRASHFLILQSLSLTRFGRQLPTYH